MSQSLCAHPFSSCCQKVLTALYENATPHTVRMLGGSGTAARPSFARAVDEARPFRHFFPPGAPDRD